MHASSYRMGSTALLAVVILGAVGCGSTEKATVEIQYALNPSKGLPPGMEKVAILDAKVNEVTDTKWSEMAANYIQELIQDSNERYGTNLRVADRKHTSTVIKEADMAAAGLTSSISPGAAAKLLDVQGVVMAEINVKVEKHQGKGRTISGLSLWGGGGRSWGHGGGSARSSEVDKESRHITVQTDFKLVDSATSENWVTHSPRPYRQTDKTKVSPFFGSAQTEESMTPRDEIIGAAVETGARQFVSKMIPCTVRYGVELQSSSGENCVQGVKLLRGDMVEEALSRFKMAVAEDPDDVRAVYALGVACEMTGRYKEALANYRQACVLAGDPEVIQAQQRMAEYADRIRSAGAAPNQP
ncbi:MAG: tetratricopeptide repeat protein, partial [bacterium]|nr:tetratricopeptide repeat protein [bacterium]